MTVPQFFGTDLCLPLTSVHSNPKDWKDLKITSSLHLYPHLFVFIKEKNTKRYIPWSQHTIVSTVYERWYDHTSIFIVRGDPSTVLMKVKTMSYTTPVWVPVRSIISSYNPFLTFPVDRVYFLEEMVQELSGTVQEQTGESSRHGKE